MRACQATPRNNGLVAVQPRIWLFGRGAWADFLASLTGLDLKAHRIFSSYSFRLPPATENHNALIVCLPATVAAARAETSRFPDQRGGTRGWDAHGAPSCPLKCNPVAVGVDSGGGNGAP